MRGPAARGGCVCSLSCSLSCNPPIHAHPPPYPLHTTCTCCSRGSADTPTHTIPKHPMNPGIDVLQQGGRQNPPHSHPTPPARAVGRSPSFPPERCSPRKLSKIKSNTTRPLQHAWACCSREEVSVISTRKVLSPLMIRSWAPACRVWEWCGRLLLCGRALAEKLL